MWYVVIGLVLIIALAWWRIGSVARGGDRRDERIMERLAPLAQRIRRGEGIPPAEMADLCGRWEVRPLLYPLLTALERLDLWPASMTSWESQAEGLLAYWMMHPNELREPPAELRCAERVERDVEGRTVTFLVLEYRMPKGHWAGDDVKLGVAGPFVENTVPYAGTTTAYARWSDTRASVEPAALVDRFATMVRPLLH